MKKMFFQLSGMGLKKLLGATVILLGLMVFAQSAQAQNGFSADATTVSSKLKPSNGQQVTFANLVDAGTAIQRLKAQYLDYQSASPSNPNEEVLINVSAIYVEAVGKSLMAGNSVDDALASQVGLIEVTNQNFQPAFRVNPGDVVQNITQLLAN